MRIPAGTTPLTKRQPGDAAIANYFPRSQAFVYAREVSVDRRANPHNPRPRFSALAREAIENAVSDALDSRAHWRVGINAVSVCWPARGQWHHVVLLREAGRLQGYYGESLAWCELEELSIMPGQVWGAPIGLRVSAESLGDAALVRELATDEGELRARLESIAGRLIKFGPGWLQRYGGDTATSI